MPERADVAGNSPKYSRVQSLRGGLILEQQNSEKKKSVEPARFADLEPPRKLPEKAEPVWTPPVEDSKPQPTEYEIVKKTILRKVKKPKKKKLPRAKNPYGINSSERALTKPHRAIVSKSRQRVEGTSVPDHMVDEVMGARINVTHINQNKDTCLAVVSGQEVWIPMSAVMWLDKGWKDNIAGEGEEAEDEEESTEYTYEEVEIEEKVAVVRERRKPEPTRRQPEKNAPPSKVVVVEDAKPKSAMQKAYDRERESRERRVTLSPVAQVQTIGSPTVELQVLNGDPEPDVEQPLVEKEESQPPAITTNDMIIDCCCCRSHSVRKARVEFWDTKNPDDLRKAMEKMGIRDTIKDFAENEHVRQGLRSSSLRYRNLAEIILVAAIVFLFISASRFVDTSESNTYAIVGGVLCAVGLGFYHLAGLRQEEYENRTEEVNEYIARYKLDLEPHTILGRLEEKANNLTAYDKKALLGIAANRLG